MQGLMPAERVRRIKPSPSSAAAQRARDMKSQGRDIISLTTGEPDFDTPDHVIEAACAAMQEGQTRYTGIGGTADLKAAICTKFAHENGLEYAPEEVMASTGGKQVIFNALMATVNHGDEVIIPVPSWVSYPDMVLVAGGRPVTVPCGMQSGFKLSPDSLEAAITDRTRWLILNSPSNPSGALYSAAELRALGEVLARHPNVLVMTDDMYEHILFDGRSFVTIAQVCSDLKNRTLTVNGVSKAYAMTGWRIGFCGGPAALLKEMVKLQSQSTSNPCSISQAAAVAALLGPKEFFAERAVRFQRRRDTVVAMLNAIDGIRCAVPQGAFYVYPSCVGLLGRCTPTGKVLENDGDVADYFLESVGVATVHGAAFGYSPHFRISIAASDDTLKDACARLQRACQALRRGAA
jgi:aspartate aminotransferase